VCTTLATPSSRSRAEMAPERTCSSELYWSSVNATPRDAVLRTDFDDIRGASVGPSGSPSAPTLDERRPLSSSRADAQGELRAASCRKPLIGSMSAEREQGAHAAVHARYIHG